MRPVTRFSPCFLLLAAWTALLIFCPVCSPQQAPSAVNAGHGRTVSTEDSRGLYQRLNELRPDGAQVYAVHELNLRRDVIRFTFTEGKLAFLPSIDGHVTGAVFTGRGHVLATPRDPGERRSLAQFVGVPILDQTFTRAYLRFTDDTAAEVQEQLKSGGSEGAEDLHFAESWNSSVATLAPSQSLRIMLDMLSTDPLPFFYALLAGDSVGGFDVMVDSRRDEQVLMGQFRVTNDVRFYDVWASFRAENASSAPIESFAPVDYQIDSTIATDLSLEGKTVIHVKTIRPGDRLVRLELSRKLAVEKVQSDDGQRLVFFQNEDLGRQDVLRRGDDSVFVVLPASSQAGGSFHFEIYYHGNVISDAGNGVKYVGERETWYPHLTGGNLFVPFDLTFRWPRKFTLVATGTRAELHEEGDVKIGHWRSGVPFWVAGFNMGEYKMETATEQPRIQLYANKQLEEAITSRLAAHAPSIPTIDRPTPDLRPEAIIEPPLPSPAAALRLLGRRVLDSIHFYEKVNGAFPFDHLDVAQIPGSLGQGWPGLVYLSTLAFLPAEEQERAGFGGWEQGEARDLMPFHEVAHQWWGNVVAARSYRDTWIEEGISNYLALLYAASQKSTSDYSIEWLAHYRSLLLAKPPGSNEATYNAGTLSLGVRLRSSKTPDAYRTIIYGKGTWVIHMLHQMMRDPAGRDGDARFRQLLQLILTKYRYRPFTTEDLQREVEQEMTPAMDLEGNRRMDWFFDEWVKETGIPRYSVKFEVKPRGNEFVVAGRLEQSGVDDLFTAPVPLYATRPGPGSKPVLLGVVITRGSETRFRFTSRIRPTHLSIDPHMTILCQTN
jgi:Peptidase family M1 domain